MTLKLIHGAGQTKQPRIPQDHELEELLRESIEHVAEQQRTAEKVPAEFRTGTLVHAEIQDGFLIEIYQVGIAKFYSVTANASPRQRGGQKRRERGQERKGTTPYQRTLESALAVARRRAAKRSDWFTRNGGTRQSLVPARRKRQPRTYLTTADVSASMMKAIAPATAATEDERFKRADGVCPICERPVARNYMALHSHLMAHVRKKEIDKARKKEIQGKMMKRGAA